MASDGQTQLYVNVNPSKCCGYKLCAEACPEVFKIDDQGFAYTENQRVPPGLEATSREAADLCPEEAIYVGAEPPASA